MRHVIPTLSFLLLVACSQTTNPTSDADTDGAPDTGSDALPDAGSTSCGRRGREEDVVWTSGGPFRGELGPGVAAFRGIPFAEPPIGDLRWRPPVSAGCQEVERTANAWPSACLQLDADRVAIGDEDCLYLNVWTPTGTPPAGGRPVMVFIHGGGNVQGSTSNERGGIPTYDGALWAVEQDAVVVSIGYRLGALGFLAHPALAAESAEGASGNYGILDQIEALRWVRDNATAFGGDPSRVLLFGESGGARDVCVLLASPLANGLFSRALMQSGFCGELPREERESQGLAHADTVACADGDVATCLRAVPAPMLAQLAASPVTDGLVADNFGPNVDGWVLPDDPLAMITRGEHNHVPFVVGANAEETTVFGVPLTMTEAAYQQRVRLTLGPVIGDRALALYASDDFGSPRDAYVALTTDAQFVCPARRIAVAAAGSQSEPVYRYLFSHSAVRALGAFHGAELFYLFGGLDALGVDSPDAEELAARMRSDWASFADTGDLSPAWPPYDSTDPYIDLDQPIALRSGLRTEYCDFWDELAARP